MREDPPSDSRPVTSTTGLGGSLASTVDHCLFHHVDESGELGRFGLGNRSHCWCGGVCVIKSEGEGHGTVQYKMCGIMDLL